MTSDVSIFQIFEERNPEVGTHVLAFIGIHSTDTGVAIVLLNFQALSYLPIELVVYNRYCASFFEVDFSIAVLAMQCDRRFIIFVFLDITFVLSYSGTDLFLCFSSVWRYSTRTWNLVNPRVAVFRELGFIF